MRNLLEEDDQGPIGVTEMKAKEAKSKCIAALTVMDECDLVKNISELDDIALIADTELKNNQVCNLCLYFVETTWTPLLSTSSKLFLAVPTEETDFYPIWIEGGLPNEKQFNVNKMPYRTLAWQGKPLMTSQSIPNKVNMSCLKLKLFWLLVNGNWYRKFIYDKEYFFY